MGRERPGEETIKGHGEHWTQSINSTPLDSDACPPCEPPQLEASVTQSLRTGGGVAEAASACPVLWVDVKPLWGLGVLELCLVLTVFCRKNWKSQKVSCSCSNMSWKSITISWKPCWYSGVEGGGSVRRNWWEEGPGPRLGFSPRLTSLGVADITQEQGLLQFLLINEHVAQRVFVIQFLDVIC